jgi:hypothetical protein
MLVGVVIFYSGITKSIVGLGNVDSQTSTKSLIPVKWAIENYCFSYNYSQSILTLDISNGNHVIIRLLWLGNADNQWVQINQYQVHN